MQLGRRIAVGRRSVARAIHRAIGRSVGDPSVAPSASAASGRAIKIGFVSPTTGPLAGFGEADKFVQDGVMAALKDGIQVGGDAAPDRD